MVLQGHVKNENHYISIIRVPMGTKVGRMMAVDFELHSWHFLQENNKSRDLLFSLKRAMSVTLKIHSQYQYWCKMQSKFGTVGFLVVKETKGKILIVGKSKEFEAHDHNISVLLLILDIILVHFMLE